MKATSLDLLPCEHHCKLCDTSKPLNEMMVVYERATKLYKLRPRCKECNNARERGHRREWKKQYLQKWRKNNAKLNESYWRNDQAKERNRINAKKRFDQKHAAILIQIRMRKRGCPISIAEAETLLKRFGPCYPLKAGLSPKGLRECERIRSALRRQKKKRISTFEIRLMVYDDDKSNYIKPKRQKMPYQHAANTLRKWHQEKKNDRKAHGTDDRQKSGNRRSDYAR